MLTTAKLAAAASVRYSLPVTALICFVMLAFGWTQCSVFHFGLNLFPLPLLLWLGKIEHDQVNIVSLSDAKAEQFVVFADFRLYEPELKRLIELERHRLKLVRRGRE